MDDTHRHIILYAKGWYKARTDAIYQRGGSRKEQIEQEIEDLLLICFRIYQYENYPLSYLWSHLVNVFLEYVPRHEQEMYLNRLWTAGDRMFGGFTGQADFKTAIADLLGKFSIIQVKDNPKMEEIGEPDYELFPELKPKEKAVEL